MRDSLISDGMLRVFGGDNPVLQEFRRWFWIWNWHSWRTFAVMLQNCSCNYLRLCHSSACPGKRVRTTFKAQSIRSVNWYWVNRLRLDIDSVKRGATLGHDIDWELHFSLVIVTNAAALQLVIILALLSGISWRQKWALVDHRLRLLLLVSFENWSTNVVVTPAIIVSVLDLLILRDGLSRLGSNFLRHFLDRWFARIAWCLWAHTAWIGQAYWRHRVLLGQRKKLLLPSCAITFFLALVLFFYKHIRACLSRGKQCESQVDFELT